MHTTKTESTNISKVTFGASWDRYGETVASSLCNDVVLRHLEFAVKNTNTVACGLRIILLELFH